MKKKILIFKLLMTLSAISIYAQCIDCEESENWHFAAGVTLYSNNHYVTFQNVLERQPLEFNFRYKLGGNHVLRASVPIIWKANKHGEPEVVQNGPTGKFFKPNSLEEYYELLHNKDWSLYYYTKPIHYYESLYGLSIGYDYDFPVWKSLSIFGGLNISFNYSEVHSKFFSIDYDEPDEKYKSKISTIALKNQILSRSTFNVNPMLGMRYQFQRILFEASIGYNLLRSVSGIKYNNSYIEVSSGIKYGNPTSGTMEPYTDKYLLYGFSIYYTF